MGGGVPIKVYENKKKKLLININIIFVFENKYQRKPKSKIKNKNNMWKPPLNNRKKNKNGKTILRLRF